jgi:hypothetical protein
MTITTVQTEVISTFDASQHSDVTCIVGLMDASSTETGEVRHEVRHLTILAHTSSVSYIFSVKIFCSLRGW